jgi:osmotically-inducible protein OsmY
MRWFMTVIAAFALLAGGSWAHTVEEAPPAADSSGQKAGDAKGKEDAKGPLERAGAELDRALGKTAEVITNAALEFRVKNHLHNHRGLPWRELAVTANNGEVTVEGEVESEEISAKVLDTVKNTTGVTGVVNKLKIKSNPVSL